MGEMIRAISQDGGVLCFAVDSTDIVNRAEQIHKTSAVVTAALGRFLTAASLMGTQLKSPGNSLTLRISGKGPAGPMIAVSDDRGNVRGYVSNPVVELPLNRYGKLDVSGAVGTDGELSVVKDIGLKEPYIGRVPIATGEIAEDIASYYAQSEQTPTVCALGVLVNPDLTVRAAGGYLIQLLPGVGEETIAALEKNLQDIPPVSSMIDSKLTPAQICEKVLAGFEPNIIDRYPVQYRCDCSEERVRTALLSLGSEELHKMADEQPETEVCCHFCEKKYHFSADEIRKMACQKA